MPARPVPEVYHLGTASSEFLQTVGRSDATDSSPKLSPGAEFAVPTFSPSSLERFHRRMVRSEALDEAETSQVIQEPEAVTSWSRLMNETLQSWQAVADDTLADV